MMCIPKFTDSQMYEFSSDYKPELRSKLLMGGPYTMNHYSVKEI